MRKLFCIILSAGCLLGQSALGEEMQVWHLVTESGEVVTEICYEPEVGDEYIDSQNRHYSVYEVAGHHASVTNLGKITLPETNWLDASLELPVLSARKRIALYCTHSDECYEPSDGHYSTRGRGTIYDVAQQFADDLKDQGIEAVVDDALHHPHDAGAYRRSRKTAVQLLKQGIPDAMIDIHRDGIRDPNSYTVTIGGKPLSKIRLLVGRGNQNAEINKEFALQIKSVADRVYPGLIKDIYMGKGAFNQDLLPHSILFECGTYTMEKERVLATMPLMADVMSRVLNHGVIGSVGQGISDSKQQPNQTASVVWGVKDPPVSSDKGAGAGFAYLIVVTLAVLTSIMISAKGLRQGTVKVKRNIRELGAGILGKPPKDEGGNEQT